jgi:L-threonylcarbamoyladenylate synthase
MKTVTFDDKKYLKELLLKDEVIAFPTETVFGLGVISTSENAYNHLVKVKLRAPDKPFTLMCSSIEQMEKYVELDEISRRVVNKYMPGSITLILPVHKGVPGYITLNSGFIGVRIPGNKELRDLIEYIGEPLLVPSANKAGEKPALSSEEVIKVFDNEIQAVVKGECITNVPSTIVKISNGIITLVRQGPIPFEEIVMEGNKKMKIVVGADHGGYEYKKEIIKYLNNKGIETIDVGTFSADPASWSEFGLKAAFKVASKEADLGVVLCKSGIGVCIAANKVKGAYCGLAYSDEVTPLLKKHDGCNMIAFAAAYTPIDVILKRIDTFINTEFEGGRHQVRLDYLKDFEKNSK